MRILLINPTVDVKKTVGFLHKTMTPVAPLGLAYLSAILKQNGHYAFIHDQFAIKSSPEEIFSIVQKKNFDLIGFSILTPNMPEVEKTVKLVRLKNPAIKIIAGNLHSSVYKNHLLKNNLCDFVICGEGEYSTLQLLNELDRGKNDFSGIPGLAWKNINGEIIINPSGTQIKNLDSLPFPDWDDLKLNHYLAPPSLLKRQIILPIIYRRGCPFKCTFCSQHYHYPEVVNRSIDNLLDEIERNIERHNIFSFGFQDGIFPLSENEALEFSNKMIKRGLNKKCKWITEARVNTVNYNSLSALKEAGLYMIMYGFESGNEAILDRHNKMQTLTDSRNAIEWTKKLNISSYGLFIIGLPGETEATIEDTVRFAIELDPDIVKFNRYIPYPGSFLFHDSKNDFEIFNTNPESMSAWSSDITEEHDAFYLNGITTKRLYELQKKALLRFYCRPKKILQLLRINLFEPHNLMVNFNTLINLLLSSLKQK